MIAIRVRKPFAIFASDYQWEVYDHKEYKKRLQTRPLAVSEKKYQKKGNAVRAAKKIAKMMCCDVFDPETKEWIYQFQIEG